MGSERSVREVVDLIVELDLVDPKSIAQNAFLTEALDKPLSYYGHTEQSAVRHLLDEVGIRYAFDYKTFRGINECTTGERREWYEAELQSLAACARGKMTITDVRLVENDAEWELQFDCNGTPEAWPVDAGDDDEDIEAAITFAAYPTSLFVDLVDRFCMVSPPDSHLSGELVFGNPAALERLGNQFGLTFTP
jgi:hypothetical protein